nr:hypothetical protein CFP56_62769 [Quercus suber]
MDSSNHGASSRTLRSSAEEPRREGRPSIDAVLSRKLTKQRSLVTPRSSQHPTAPVLPQTTTPGFPEEHKSRKGSLRNVVRRIFGGRKSARSSGGVVVSSPRRSPIRHQHHQSNPESLPAHREPPRHQSLGGTGELARQRIVSVPIHLDRQSMAAQRVRSPYAVEFPHSSRLKPLNLGNPVTAPGSQLRRRRTLPSVLIPESDAAALSQSISAASKPPPVPSLATSGRDASTPQVTSTTAKRRSRSADDLIAAFPKPNTQRKRSDEIRYWRESLQPPDVLRASGFVTKRSLQEPREVKENHKISIAPSSDSFMPDGAKVVSVVNSGTPPRQAHLSADTDIFASASGYGSELSRDLEDRVAKLESGLFNFRHELQRLTTERHRRTVLVDDNTAGRRLSLDERSPIMLAATLQNAEDFQTYPYEYGHSDGETPRPSTAQPRVPEVPSRREFTVVSGNDDPFVKASADAPSSRRSGKLAAKQTDNAQTEHVKQMPQHTFRSLYEMLADERSARRKLETQLKSLRNEIQGLQQQVSTSNTHSERNSYLPMLENPIPKRGSTRLQDLLRETAPSPPGSSGRNRDSGATGPSYHENDRVVSRFSASESEAGPGDVESGDRDVTQTPYQEFQTPAEEWESHERRFPTPGLPGHRTSTPSDSDMF